MQPYDQRFLVVGEITEAGFDVYNGSRSGLIKIKKILIATKDPQVRLYAKDMLSRTSELYDDFWKKNRKAPDSPKDPIEFLTSQTKESPPSPADVRGVINMMQTDQDLNHVAAATVAFRELTKAPIGMFDFAALDVWCKEHEEQCSIQK